jgi:molybdopterin-guanine dinucleotide biosynthesis protein A
VADRRLTGVLLVGGASRRFGSPKALAQFGGQTLAERAWALLAASCDERIAVGKGDLDFPFPVLDDGTELQAPIVGVRAGLRAASHELVVVIPVDMPLLTTDVLQTLADACRDVAVPRTGPLPGAYRRGVEARFADGLSLRDAIRPLDVAVVDVDERTLANVNEPADLMRLERVE